MLWEFDLCFGKLFCVLVNLFVIDPFGPPYDSLGFYSFPLLLSFSD